MRPAAPWTEPRAGPRRRAHRPRPGVPARTVLRRHAVRRGHGDRGRRARADRVQHPARPGAGRWPTTCAPIGPRHDRLRRRRAHRGPAAPDDRPALRLERLAAEAADPTCGVLLLDVVLGHGAHPDPAAELAPAIRRARAWPQRTAATRRRGVAGRTADDPQGLERRPGAARRRRVGAPSNAAAARAAVDAGRRRTRRERAAGPASRSSSPPASTCSPTRSPRRRCRSSGWTGGRRAGHRGRTWPRCAADPRRAAANAHRVARMLRRDRRRWSTSARRARRSGWSPASSCTPARRSTWERASGPLRGALIGAMLLEGLADDAGARPSACSPPATASSSSRATTAARSGRWPAWCRPSMWVFELRDEVHDGTSWCSLNEGLGKVLRYGAYGPEVIDRLRWMTDVLGPRAGRRGARARPGRRQGDRRPDDPDGRRGPQPQPRRAR